MSQANNRKAKADTREYEQVKKAMVAAAVELMAGEGYRKFRFDLLAEKVGYNRATIYRYFDSKQDLTTEVMMALMREITEDIIRDTVGNQVTRQTFSESLYVLILKLRTDPRYAIVMDAQNIHTFARLMQDYFSGITTSMLEKFLMNASSGPVLKQGIKLSETVNWLLHQIVSYGFFGIAGETKKEQIEHLERMVVSVILE